MNLSDLPAVNAGLNSLSAVFLTAGYIFIRHQHQVAHRNCMIGAVISSALFLTCYIIYHYNAGRTTFRDPAWFRPIYLTILLTHTILAVAIVPMVLMTLYRAARRQFESHKRISRWTWPIWIYVSVTGVLIYFLLYHIFPQRPG
jgi:putative membrane protein